MKTNFKDLIILYLLTFVFSLAIWIPEVLYILGLTTSNSYIVFFESNRLIALIPSVGSLVILALMANLKIGGLPGMKSKLENKKFEKKMLLSLLILLPIVFPAWFIISINL